MPERRRRAMDRVTLLIRGGIAVALGGIVLLPWVDRDPGVGDWIIAGVAVIAIIGMIVSLVFHDRLTAARTLDPAAALAAFVLLYDAFESILGQEQKGVSIARTACMSLGIAFVALAVMLAVRYHLGSDEP